ncbi:hypothetical protein ACFY0A_17010 [Streptomyces sp. NPDC001698]|uniref:hypothetical protein n=1 Tax=Streptomyces sp. NPDC001698 TaxID=3364601 RepID=UPI0036B9A2C3
MPVPSRPPAPLPRSRATTLRIPSLGIDAPIIRVGLDGDRELRPPPVDKPKRGPAGGWRTAGLPP